jgi:hypothetical protein
MCAWHDRGVVRTVKKIVVVLSVLLIAPFLYFAHAYWHLKLQSEAANRTRAELERGYQAQLAQYQHALRIGIPRSEVREYLDARKITYDDWGGEMVVKLGREPDVFPCDSWNVYVSFEFGRVRPQDEPSPSDPLGAVTLKRIGHCL